MKKLALAFLEVGSMPKYYVKSGPVQLVFDACDELTAAIKAFQWTCDRQAEIDAPTPLAHVQEAERRGWQLHETVHVNERGFGRFDHWQRPTLEVVEAWMEGSWPLA